jgi:hypothetical protein
VAHERQFEIVDDDRAVHGEGGDDAAFHQIDDERAQADLHHMGAHADDHRPAVAMGCGNGLRHLAQRFDRQDIGE